MNAYGLSMTLAAIALEMLDNRPVRLCWCVDLTRDVGPDADSPADPTDPARVETKWGALLLRLKDRLEAQPHEGQAARFNLYVRHTLQSSGQRVLTSWRLPYAVKIAFVAAGKPPVGCWYLQSYPEDPFTGGAKDDQLPSSWWYDGIPF